MAAIYGSANNGWAARSRHRRAARALERQLIYQRKKAEWFRQNEDELIRSNFVRAQAVRQRLELIGPVPTSARVLEVGSGAHGLIFGFGPGFGVGIDPLAAEYRSLFPKLQMNAATVAAAGEHLPFDDASFDVVLSDNVIDHAERPLDIVDEMVRVLRPGGIFYFTVNVHHGFYDLASRAYGAWNAVGAKLELSAFADHTVHLTKKRISQYIRRTGLTIVQEQNSVAEIAAEQRRSATFDADSLLKRFFFKNALYEAVAVKP